MMTRRIFAKTLAAGVAMAAVPLRGQHKLNIGIGTYSYHNLSIDEMIVQLNTLRIQEIEMSRGEFMLFSKPEISSSEIVWPLEMPLSTFRFSVAASSCP